MRWIVRSTQRHEAAPGLAAPLELLGVLAMSSPQRSLEQQKLKQQKLKKEKLKKEKCKPKEQLTLEPYHRDHALVVRAPLWHAEFSLR